jgi:alpha-2-macroglobulin
LNDKNQPKRFDSLRVGDRVLVTLRLTVPEPADYLAVDDPLPSLFEAVNSAFKTDQMTAGTPPAWMGKDDGDFWSGNFREIRKDRVLFFTDHIGPGTYVIHYVARVRAAGSVTAPPAKAEAMYHPDRFGLTETQRLTSQGID